MNTIIIIPAYKPGEALISTVTELHDMGYEIIVVDDGSGDEYKEIFMSVKPYACVLRKKTNYGKGAALKSGIDYILKNRPDCGYLITADADGQHKSYDIARLDAALCENGGFYIGSREFVGDVPFRSYFGNMITRKVFKAVSGTYVGDTQTGLRGADRSLFKWLCSVEGQRYEYEMNMLLDAAEKGIPIHEIPIETVYENNNASSHFNAFKDSAKIYKCILNYALHDEDQID